MRSVAVKAFESNDAAVITGGVDEGAKIVALGAQKLDPAQKVRVVPSTVVLKSKPYPVVARSNAGAEQSSKYSAL